MSNQQGIPDTAKPTTAKTWDYIRELFDPTDPIAVILINNKTGATEQKVRAAGQVAAPEYQAHLRARNAQGFSVYTSMNPLFGNFTLRLPIAPGNLEPTRNALEGTPGLADYKTHLVWKHQAATQDEAKKQAHETAKLLREHLSRLPDLMIQVFAQRLQKDLQAPQHLVRLTIPAGMLDPALKALSPCPSLATPEITLLWNVRAATIPEAKQQAQLTEGNLKQQLAGVQALPIAVYQDHSRLKEDVREIRRLYLDIDDSAADRIQQLFADAEAKKIPTPNYVIHTSPNKCQVVWTVEPGLTQQRAEDMLRTLAREYGGDPVCSDISRVFRLPGLQNKKYAEYVPVRGERWTTTEYKISDFDHVKHFAETHAAEDAEQRIAPYQPGPARRSTQAGLKGRGAPNSPSHRDWHYCCRELESTIYRSPDRLVSQNLEKTYLQLHEWLINNCSERHKNGTSEPPFRYAQVTIRELRNHITPKIPIILQKRRVDSGLAEADQKLASLAPGAECFPANSQSGIYIGTFIGETSKHFLQRLSPKTVIAHRKQDFATSNIQAPSMGRGYTVQYANHAVTAQQKTFNGLAQASKQR